MQYPSYNWNSDSLIVCCIEWKKVEGSTNMALVQKHRELRKRAHAEKNLEKM